MGKSLSVLRSCTGKPLGPPQLNTPDGRFFISRRGRPSERLFHRGDLSSFSFFFNLSENRSPRENFQTPPSLSLCVSRCSSPARGRSRQRKVSLRKDAVLRLRKEDEGSLLIPGKQSVLFHAVDDDPSFFIEDGTSHG